MVRQAAAEMDEMVGGSARKVGKRPSGDVASAYDAGGDDAPPVPSPYRRRGTRVEEGWKERHVVACPVEIPPPIMQPTTPTTPRPPTQPTTPTLPTKLQMTTIPKLSRCAMAPQRSPTSKINKGMPTISATAACVTQTVEAESRPVSAGITINQY